MLWPNDSSDIIVYPDNYYHSHIWLRDGKPHWAYNTRYLHLVPNRKSIEWTPNTIASNVVINESKATVTLHSNTPNFKTYQMKEMPDGDWKDVADSLDIELKKESNEMIFRAVNIAGVAGPEHKIIIAR